MRRRSNWRAQPGAIAEACQLMCGGIAVVWLGGVFICASCYERALAIAETTQHGRGW